MAIWVILTPELCLLITFVLLEQMGSIFFFFLTFPKSVMYISKIKFSTLDVLFFKIMADRDHFDLFSNIFFALKAMIENPCKKFSDKLLWLYSYYLWGIQTWDIKLLCYPYIGIPLFTFPHSFEQNIINKAGAGIFMVTFLFRNLFYCSFS